MMPLSRLYRFRSLASLEALTEGSPDAEVVPSSTPTKLRMSQFVESTPAHALVASEVRIFAAPQVDNLSVSQKLTRLGPPDRVSPLVHSPELPAAGVLLGSAEQEGAYLGTRLAAFAGWALAQAEKDLDSLLRLRMTNEKRPAM